MILWVCAIAALLITAPILRERFKRPVDDATRAAAPGQFARLSQGVTHYQWHGSDGPMVVCVHGLTTPSFVWQALAAGLVQMGFRVLAYDLYGRGYSDHVPGAQDHAFFQTQLTDLLADQDVGDNITLIGYSMGGAIATVFAAQNRARLRRLILLAPAGMRPVATGWVGSMIRTPLVGSWLMLLTYPRSLRAGLAAEADQLTHVKNISTLQTAELGRRGFVPSVHASLCGALATTLHTEHHALRDAGLPVLAIWGADDAVIPLAASKQLHHWNTSAQTAIIDTAGHGLPYTHTPDALGHIARFLPHS
ncbi:alpha/beta hydrolase [Roseobacter sp.]|uniref:alpha/beta fold hydrolase n=1 Tax=Roseobacter sp. TaxID=1907202 RepID=UPI003298EA6E